MTSSYYKISLDIHDHGSHVSLKAKKGDTGRLLYVTFMDGGKPYAITEECRAVFTAKKADGNILFNSCSIIGNTICYTFTPQTTAAVGKADCEIKLYGADDKLLTSARFTLMVEDTVYNEGDEVESSNEFSALTDLMSEVAELLATDIKGDKGDQGEKGEKGDQGDKGEKGDKGDSGVNVTAGGYFALEVDTATGDLYCITEDGDPRLPMFTMDDYGNLYYELKEA